MGSKTSFTGCFYGGLASFLFLVSVKKAMQKLDTERKQTPIKKTQTFFILDHISVLLHTNVERSAAAPTDNLKERKKSQSEKVFAKGFYPIERDMRGREKKIKTDTE